MNYKSFLLLIINGFSLLSAGLCQNTPSRICNELNKAVTSGQSFLKIQLLNSEAPSINQHFQKTYAKANYWIQDLNAFKQLEAESPSLLSLELMDYQNNTLTLLLQKQELFGGDSRLITADDPNHRQVIQSGFYYRGIVKEYPGSIAAFSFFEDQTMAVISLPAKGNLVLGKMKSESIGAESELPHVLYYENELPQKSNFFCGVTDLLPDRFRKESLILSPDTIYSSHCKTTKVFLECDYQLYLDYNGSVTQVKNYITGLFNVVKTLYYNELVNLEISDIMVWNIKDPFLHTDLSSIIYNYSSYRKNNFTGNLAQLVTTFAPQQQGGIAFLGTLCQPYNGSSGPHSFAYIYKTYNQLPTYSWSVEVMTHEMGHNFGSPHTHACFWGPTRNMTLDNCQNPENNACAPGPTPVNGGTIMSYCHLTGIGINFSNGFGKEPGDLIRTNVENRTCLSSQFTPIIVENFNPPFYEGDNIILKARPSKSTYDYDWFHYDYLMSTPKDSILRPTYSGIYKAAISSNPCTEYSSPDTVEISDFLVNLGCPVIHGFRDSVQASVTLNFNKQGTLTDSLVVPDSLYLKVPAGVKDVLVELQTKIAVKGNSWLRDVASAYQAPTVTGISNNKYTPNSSEPTGSNVEKTYSRILGRFNPKGVWHFTSNYSRFVSGIDMKLTFSVVISWRKEDSIPPCRIALCDGQSKTFDAGIQSAKYTWSTGATTKTISTNQEGSLSVQVTKGSKKSSHTVELYYYPTNYSQINTICDGDTVSIGKHHYTKSGTYSDSLIASNGCDSIISSVLEVLPIQKSRDSLFICYGDQIDSVFYYKNALLTFHHTAINGCDSIHQTDVIVDQEIKIQSVSVPACPEIGGSLEAIASGGSGTVYKYEWSNGQGSNKIDNVQTGIYTVKAIDSTGCVMEKEVELINLDSVGILALVVDVSCNGKEDGKIFIDFNSGSSPFTSNWSNGASIEDLVDLKAGKYTLFARDANGCRKSKEIEVLSPELLFVQVDAKGSNGNDGSAKLDVTGGTAPYTYFWSTGESTPEINGLAPGNYWVFVHDKNGCEFRNDFVIQELVSTNQDKQNDLIKIFPLPVKDHLLISFETSNIITKNIFWKIYDVHARTWNEGEFNSKEKLHAIDVEAMLSGVYIIELRTSENIVFRKMILKD